MVTIHIRSGINYSPPLESHVVTSEGHQVRDRACVHRECPKRLCLQLFLEHRRHPAQPRRLPADLWN